MGALKDVNKKIEETIVEGYKKIEDTVVGSYKKVEDKFVDKFAPLEFKGGVVAGTYYDQNNIQKIAKIPSRNELLARLFGSWKSPMSSFARVVNEIAKKNGGGVSTEETAEAAE